MLSPNHTFPDILLGLLAAAGVGLADGPSQWVYPGAPGKLAYRAVPTRDQIMDSSSS